MKFCPNCRITFDDSASNCSQCGAPLMTVPNTAAADPTDHTAEFDPADIHDNKLFAMMPYIFSLVGMLIAVVIGQKSPYTMFHVKQALKIQILAFISVIFSIVPIIGWIATSVCMIIAVVVEIICFVRVCQNKAIEAPIASKFGFLK